MKCSYFDAGYCFDVTGKANRDKNSGCLGREKCEVHKENEPTWKRMPDSVAVVNDRSSPYDRIYTLNEHEIKQRKVIFDYYKISAMCEVNDPWLDHAGKKILFGCKRGHKDLIIDIEEAIKTLHKKLDYLRESEQ